MSSLDKNFIGHQENWDILSKDIIQNRMPSAYLFYGPPGIGKSLVAINYVAALFCIKKSGNRACGICLSCEKVFSSKHPDFISVLPKENRKSISVDQCREIITMMQLAPLESTCKIVLFSDTSQLGEAGWNALLKSIEEPQPNRLYILCSTSLSRVLPTIRSRCRKMAFSPPSLTESGQLLMSKRSVSSEVITEALNFSGGSIGLALAILDQGIIDFVQQFKQLSKFQDTVTLSDKLIKSDTNITLFFQAYVRATLDEYKNSQNPKYLEKIDKILQAQRDIQGNINKSFVFENLHL